MNSDLKRDNRQQGQIVFNNENGLSWASKNRRSVFVFGGFAILLVLILVGLYSIDQHRTASAETAFGEAMQTYQTPVVRAGQALPPGMKAFHSAAERAKAANGQFQQVASSYGMTEPGKMAQYFAGLTYMEAGQNSQAEQALEVTAHSWNGNMAALGKAALAELYAQTGRVPQAVALYQELAKGHATTVPPELAELQLGDLYESQGNTQQAREIYAHVKDHDKDAKGRPGIAAQVAGRKLNPEAANSNAGGA